jgi:hypothetical protein
MRFDTKNLSIECAQTLLTNISSYVDPKLSTSTNVTKIVKELNTFLDTIYHILNPKNKYTTSNYEIRGEYLLSFAQLYQTLILNQKCINEKSSLIGVENSMGVIDIKSWTKFLCTTRKGVRPMVHLYKVLTFLALIYANCYTNSFYIKNKGNKGKEPTWLNLEEILDNLYNVNLRFSKSQTKLCLEKLEPVQVSKINKFMYMSFYIRQHYLSENYCGTILNKESDDQHDDFLICTQDLLNALSRYRSKNF